MPITKIEAPSLKIKYENQRKRKNIELHETSQKDLHIFSVRREKLRKKLYHLTSPSYYRNTTIERYRSRLNKYLAELVELSLLKNNFDFRENDGIDELGDENFQRMETDENMNIICLHYDVVIIEEVLYFGISWKELCLHYDEYINAQRDDAESSTISAPLIEICSTLLNEFIHLQTHLSLSLMVVLYKVLLLSCTFTSGNVIESSSKHLLQATLRKVLIHCPPMALLSKELCRCLRQGIFTGPNNSSSSIQRKVIHPKTTRHTIDTTIWLVQTMIQLRQYESIQCRVLAIGHDVVVNLINVLSMAHEHMYFDVHLKYGNKSQEKKSDVRKPKYQSRFLQSKQHDIDFHEINGENDKDGSGITLGTMDTVGGSFHHIRRIGAITSSRITSDSSTLSSFRVIIIKGILSIFRILTLNCHREFKYGITFRSIISLTLKKPLCPMKRIILLLGASCDIRSMYDQGLGIVFNRIWGASCACFKIPNALTAEDYGRTNSTTVNVDFAKGENLIRMYTEIIVVCKAMEKGDNCWKALEPFINTVLSISKKHPTIQNVDDDGDNRLDEGINIDPTLEQIQRCLLSGIICVIRRRATLLSKDKDRFESTLLKLSNHYGDREDLWIPTLANQEERMSILNLLVSFHVLKNNTDTNEIHEVTPAVEFSWPFFPSETMQHFYSSDAAFQESPEIGGQFSLHDYEKEEEFALSYYQTKNEMKALQEKEEAVRTKQDCNVQFLDYMNDDILRYVFTYLGYKRIVRAARVCKVWREVAFNSQMLWKEFYMKRWSNSIHHGPQKFGHWNELFKEKWIVERSIRSKFSKDLTWKFKTCNVMGCHKILRSRKMWETHLKWHEEKREKDETKEKERQAKLEEKMRNGKLKKDAKTKQDSQQDVKSSSCGS